MKTGVIIVAAGRGERAGGSIPKQYRCIKGQAVLARSIAAFRKHPQINHLIAVINPDDLPHFEAVAPDIEHVFGGASRSLSVRAGLEALKDAELDYVLIHDAARPFVPADVISRVVEALGAAAGAIPVLNLHDALLECTGGVMTGSLDRNQVRAAQTPQGFHYPALIAAYNALDVQDMADDASVLAATGQSVALVDGDDRNFKITRPEDFARAEQQVEQSMVYVTGQGFDVHRLEPADSMWLCGIEIEAGLGLVGHSDADAGLHALTDAILGAAGRGDIGQHFPPSDTQWKGASSDRFVQHAICLLEAAGGELVNADITLIAERPKIGPHRDAMRKRVAALTGLAVERVNIKATTTERLGFTGRGEGLAAQAIVSARITNVS